MNEQRDETNACLVQTIFLKITVEFPVVMAANMHSGEHDAEYALVKTVVALIGSIRRYAGPIADAIDHLKVC